MRPFLCLLFTVGLVSAFPASAIEGMLETEPGVQLYWRTTGQGTKTLIVPGGFLYQGALDVLAGDRRLILYDMRNRGRSSRIVDPVLLTIDADVRDLEAIRRHFKVESFDTIGYSYLGKMVVLYALEHPDRLERIVQIGPVAMRFGSIFPPDQDNFSEDILDAEAVAELRALRARGFHETSPQDYCEQEWRVIRARLVGDRGKADALKSNCALPNEWPTRIAFHLEHHFTSARGRDLDLADTAAVEVPVLTIHGTLDRNAAYGGGREWAAALPVGRLLTFEGAAHQVWTDSDQVTPAIREFLDGDWPENAEDLDFASESWLAQIRAHELLTRALEVHGSGTLRPTGVRFSGTLYPRSQSRRSTPPFDPFPTVDDLIIDAGRGRVSVDHELHWPDFISRVRMVATGEDGFEVSAGSGRVAPLYIAPGELRLRYLRRLPSMLIAAAMKQPGSLRLLGLRRDDKRTYSILSATVEGFHLTLWLDEQNRLRRIFRTIPDALIGDTIEETRLTGDVHLHGMNLPSTLRVFFNGVLSAELKLESVRPVKPADIAAAFTKPGEMEEGSVRVDEPISIKRLADRVWLVSNIGGADYQSLVVEWDEGLLIGEAPVDAASMETVLEFLEQTFPAKRALSVVVTHHHFDHSGGVPAMMQAGARIISTPGNASFFRQIARAPRTLAGEAPIGEIALDLVTGEKLLLVGAGPKVEVHRIHVPSHAEEMLFLWLPDERILFQGDLYVHRPGNPEPARPQSRSLIERIETAGLDVERLVGVHGAGATLEDLRAAVRAAEEQDR